MTLLQIAEAHCANWRRDRKGCLGAMIDDDLQIRRCAPKPRCSLLTRGRRCEYFEECIAPMARSIADPNQRQAFEELVRQYRVDCKLPYADERPCPVCGRPMEPRRRFCNICAEARRRKTVSSAVQRHRATSNQLTQTGPRKNRPSSEVASPAGMVIADMPAKAVTAATQAATSER